MRAAQARPWHPSWHVLNRWHSRQLKSVFSYLSLSLDLDIVANDNEPIVRCLPVLSEGKGRLTRKTVATDMCVSSSHPHFVPHVAVVPPTLQSRIRKLRCF